MPIININNLSVLDDSTIEEFKQRVQDCINQAKENITTSPTKEANMLKVNFAEGGIVKKSNIVLNFECKLPENLHQRMQDLKDAVAEYKFLKAKENKITVTDGTKEVVLNKDVEKNDVVYPDDILNILEDKTKHIKAPEGIKPESKFKPGDKVRVISDEEEYYTKVKENKIIERVDFVGFEGVIIWCNNEHDFSRVEFNGLRRYIENNDLELIERFQPIQAKPEFMNVADDIDGVLLPDEKSIELIKRY